MALEYLLGGGLLSGIGSLTGGLIGASSTKKSIKSIKSDIKALREEEARRNALVEKNLKPYVDTGHKAVNSLTGQGDPSERLPSFRDMQFYEFQREEAERQTRRGLSLRGGLFSGAGQEAEQRAIAELTGRSVAEEKNLLFSLATLGQQSAAQQGSIGASSLAGVGSVIGGLSQAAGNLTATRGQQLGQAVASPFQTLGGLAAGYGSNQQFQDFLVANPQLFKA